MSSGRHGRQTIDLGIHGIVALSYPNAAARLSASGFQTYDLNKVAEQTSDNTLWRLINISPVTWQAIATGAGIGTLSQTLANGNTTDGYNIVVSTGNVITITDQPTVATDGTNKSYTDQHLLGSLISPTTTGQTLYYDGANWTLLNPSTDGYVLTTHSNISGPTWTEPPSSTPTGPAGGDLTGTYPNPTIGTDKVLTVNILNNNVTLPKLATITTDSLLGRDTAGTGNVEVITLGASLSMTGAQVLQRAALTGDVTAAANSNTTAIAAGVIVNADVNASAAIAHSKLATITTDSLLGRDTAGTGALETITLDSTLLMNGSQVLGRSAISGDVTISAGSNAATVTDLTITSEQQGSVLYYNGTNWVQLAPATDGYVLTTHSTAANPTWTALPPTTPSGPAGGDLTGTYPNPTIDVNKVTFAKIQQIPTDSLLGRDTAGTGNVESILLNSTLVFDGSLNLGRAAISGDITIAAGSNTSAIAAGVIVNADINASAAIALSKLATQAALTVVANATNATAVPTAVAASVDGQVFLRSGTSLAFGTIATAGITDGSVTMAKLANLAGISVIGRSVNSSGVPAAITATTTGQVLIYNGTTIGFGSPDFGSLNVTSLGALTIAGITNSGAYAGGTNPASTGIIRIPNAADIVARNAANSGNISIIGTNSSDEVIVGTGSDTSIILNNTSDLVSIKTNNIAQLNISTTTIDAQDNNIITTGNISLGTTPATTGQIRLPNNTSISARNAANSADVNLITLTSSNGISIGDSSDSSVFLTNSAGSLLLGSSALELTGLAQIRYDNTVVSPSFIQEADATNGITGDTLTVQAQNATGTTSVGGDLILKSGTGTSSNGVLRLYNGSTDILDCFPTLVQLRVPTFSYISSVSSPVVTQASTSTNGVTAQTFTVNAQNATGTTSTGGKLLLASGTGTSLDGYVEIDRGATKIFESTNIGTYVGDGYIMMEATQLGTRRITAFNRASLTDITNTQMPAGTGDGVTYLAHAVTIPTANAVSGGILYNSNASNSGLCFRDTNGLCSFGEATNSTVIYGNDETTINVNGSNGMFYFRGITDKSSFAIESCNASPTAVSGESNFYSISGVAYITNFDGTIITLG